MAQVEFLCLQWWKKHSNIMNGYCSHSEKITELRNTLRKDPSNAKRSWRKITSTFLKLDRPVFRECIDEDYNFLPGQEERFALALCRYQSFQKKICWGLPTEETLEELVYILKKMNNSIHFLSLGSGNGLFECFLQGNNIDVTCTDISPMFTECQFLDGSRISYFDRINEYDGLIFAWAPYLEEWTYDSLRAKNWEYILLVSEDYGGCCASDKFFEYLEAHFYLNYRGPCHNFHGYSDSVQLWLPKSDEQTQSRNEPPVDSLP